MAQGPIAGRIIRVLIELMVRCLIELNQEGRNHMSKRHFFGFSALEITYWGFHASFIGYASAYILSRGVSNTVMSLLLSGFLLCAFIG